MKASLVRIKVRYGTDIDSAKLSADALGDALLAAGQYVAAVIDCPADDCLEVSFLIRPEQVEA